MKNTIFAALILTSSLAVPVFAQAEPNTADQPAEVALTTNELTLAAIKDLEAVIRIAATANNLENANKAAAAIKGLTAKLPAHAKAIEAAKAPTEVEKKELAITMMDAEKEMQAAVKKMELTLASAGEEVQKVMSPAVQSFFLNITPVVKAIEAHYPKDEMTAFEEAEKARRAKDAPAKKTEEKK